MSKKCDVCGKAPIKAAKLTFSHKQIVHTQEPNLQSVKVNENVQEATSGLMVLGYSRKDIEKAFEHLAVESLSVEDLIKKGLVLLTTK